MRVCYIAGGASIHVQRWVNYFARKGHEVHLISWRSMDGYDSRIQVHRLTRLPPQTWGISRYPSAILGLLQIRRLLRRIRPDILEAHYITVNGCLGALSGFHPLVLCAYGSDVLIAPRRSRLCRSATKSALRRADLVICDSETLKRGLLELGTRPNKVHKIFNGVDTRQFGPQWIDKQLQGKLGILNSPSLICFRHLSPGYNVEMLIKTIPLVLEQVPDAKFIIGGDGPHRKYLEELARSLGVLESCRFVGYIPHNELPGYVASSDIYVSTSVSDSTSLSLQEAMACELAPVVTDLPANREWVTDGENGFVVAINDIHMLAERIIQLVQDKRTRERFGKRGRELIREKAEYEKEMERMESIYQTLVRQ